MESLPESQWSTTIYAEGTAWTVRGVFAHILATERDYVSLFAHVRGGGAGVPEGFDIDRHNASQQQQTDTLEAAELVGQFRAARARMVDFVSGLTDSDLEKRGRHPFLGVVPLRDMIRLVHIHNQTHYRDVRQILRTM